MKAPARPMPLRAYPEQKPASEPKDIVPARGATRCVVSAGPGAVCSLSAAVAVGPPTPNTARVVRLSLGLAPTAGAYRALQPNPSGRPANSAASSSVGGVKFGNSETHLGTGGIVMAAAMDGIPEDSEGSRRDEDRGGAMSGLIPFFFISLRSPLRLARALSSAVLPAAFSAASLLRRLSSSASIRALSSTMASGSAPRLGRVRAAVVRKGRAPRDACLKR